jgi:hypothetical protein
MRQGETHRLLRSGGLLPFDSRYILFFPWRAKLLRSIEQRLTRLPLGAQYLAVGAKPPLSTKAQRRIR